ncbi:MAG: DNA topoisomerase [Pyrobaculum sp.]
MILVVAEKRSVAQAIAKYLGGAYRRVATHGVYTYHFQYKGRKAVALGLSGHIMDFNFSPKLNVWTWVPPEDLFKTEPVLVVREEAVPYLKALQVLAREAEEAYLALDADVEGEAIAYEAAMVIRYFNRWAKIYRVRFNAVTQGDIRRAFENSTHLDYRQVEKVFTRMQIDLTLGAVFTRFLTLSVRHLLKRGQFLSYGPCQTPVLGIVVRRELERRDFKPETYYILKALVGVAGHKLWMTSVARFKTRGEAEAAANMRRGVVKIAAYETRQISPPEPLDTIELERRSSRWLGIGAKKALDVAEELYRAGYISYPRTETTIYPPTLDLRGVLQELARGHLGHYAGELLRQGFRPTRGDVDDGAHPPIYPTRGAGREEIYRVFKRLAAYAWPIYDFVVRHFLATLSPPAVVEQQKVVVDVGIELEAEGLVVLNEGYWRVYPWERRGERPLPRVKPGDKAEVLDVEIVQRQTEPPPQMSESELLALMRRYGIGTDATMQDHIYTNVKRGYIKLVKNRCIPTPLGTAVATTLFQHAPEIIEPTVRGRIEKALAGIIKGVTTPRKLTEEIRGEFMRYYLKLKDQREEIKRALEIALKTDLENSSGGTSTGVES